MLEREFLLEHSKKNPANFQNNFVPLYEWYPAQMALRNCETQCGTVPDNFPSGAIIGGDRFAT